MKHLSLSPKQRNEHERWKEHFSKQYGFSFFEPAFEAVPYVSSLINDQFISSLLSDYEYHLLGTYPIDMGFNDAKTLARMRSELFSQEEYSWHRKHNKLSVNRWGAVTSTAETLGMLLGLDGLSSVKAPHTCYSELSFDEKMAFCTSIDEQLYTLLEDLWSRYA